MREAANTPPIEILLHTLMSGHALQICYLHSSHFAKLAKMGKEREDLIVIGALCLLVTSWVALGHHNLSEPLFSHLENEHVRNYFITSQAFC